MSSCDDLLPKLKDTARAARVFLLSPGRTELLSNSVLEGVVLLYTSHTGPITMPDQGLSAKMRPPERVLATARASPHGQNATARASRWHEVLNAAARASLSI